MTDHPETTPPSTAEALPIEDSTVGSTDSPSHADLVPQVEPARAPSSPEAIPSAPPTLLSLPEDQAVTTGQRIDEAHSEVADRDDLPAAAIIRSEPTATTRRQDPLFDAYLCLVADTLDDLERTRMANENRVRQLTRSVADSDGEQRGLGLDARSPEVARLQALVASIAALEHAAELDLKRALRTHPLYPFIKRTIGMGEKQGARLLAAIGDPYWNDLYDRPRTVSELWAYCGLAVHEGRAQRRMKGVKSNWSTTAKMRAHNVAESIVKATIRKTEGADEKYSPNTRVALSDLGQVYLDRRSGTLDRLHSTECIRCGPSGNPAQPGSPWSGAHQQADALRFVSKAVLKDLWIEARALHRPDLSAEEAA